MKSCNGVWRSIPPGEKKRRKEGFAVNGKHVTAIKQQECGLWESEQNYFNPHPIHPMSR